MAADKTTDVLMMIEKTPGKPLEAACQTQFAIESSLFDMDTLLDGFKEGYIFEIQDVDLELTAPAPDASSATKTTKGVQLSDIEITRQIDQASTVLMEYCINAKEFSGASIIKRRAAGGSVESGQAYMRVDFTGVLITKIDWSDEHIVKERITFITREVEIKYRPQASEGTLQSQTQSSDATMQAKFVVPVSPDAGSSS